MKPLDCVLGLLLAVQPLYALAEQTTPGQTVRNPRVIDKVIDMGEHLRSLTAFKVSAQVTRDTVLDSGQKIKSQSLNVLQVAGKDRLYARSEGDTRTLEFFYDGKQLTQYSPYLKYYTTVEAPPSLTETLHRLENYYGIQVPLEDLFLFGSDQAQIDALQSALYIGPATINGQLCDHLAFRQADVDWQLWLTRAEQPLPCKLVITTTSEASAPEYSAEYSWNLAPDSKQVKFRFVPGKGDVAIPLKKASE
ncbi:DUF2092 domain-containing protein [Pseudomonas rubra]|uniref:DUF2092 domain-containing protein n=1 Tax=Pseudomonas rubra TaxID=2942627 RepID=A0ABT5PFZ6_9PSED|nr:DUF2092 domain-containing protein [Pseudomonas rubra]MDD1017122.1 DUF2092 domain-containing protein [Pseudomonas rubra]MDD1037136.1 DUF2092 domain-containing protein [Pseudomonas rubra]MDD1153797.1 DUF2092 domain-containing protein [Pseudomonas rubra]